ncbi:M20/M25/M40 family metallo-hydrolase [bacterium]|nr:M20/M25/M40 family metallo-hydrolase [bacterium]
MRSDSAHLDTMPTENMTVAPFEGTIRDGRLWGRGACDTKGSVAAITAAALNVLEEDPASFPSTLLLFTCDEEMGFTGAAHFAASNHPPLKGMVIGEPSSRRLAIAHKGVVRISVRTMGKAAHASTPENGVNAILRMAPVLSALDRLGDELAHRPPHLVLGNATLNIGAIQGGLAVNIVPDLCRIDIDRRVLPDETVDGIVGELREALKDIPGCVLEDPSLVAPGFAIDKSHPWARFVSEALDQPEPGVVPYATDASILHPAGIPCVIYGPGNHRQAHAADEYIELESLRAAVSDYEQILRKARVL